MSNGTQREDIFSFKLLLLGDTTVGKTAFILRFCDNKFEDDSLTTIGLDQKMKYVKRGDKKIELHIWDTAGQERFRSIAKNLYKGADGILLMYDITKLKTFKNIKRWINGIKEAVDINKIALIIVGNKCDLRDEINKDDKDTNEKDENDENDDKEEPDIPVDEETKKEFEKQNNFKIIEASAKKDINVTDSFIALIDKMLELGLGKKKSNDDDEDEGKGQKLTSKKTNKRNNNCCNRGRNN